MQLKKRQQRKLLSKRNIVTALIAVLAFFLGLGVLTSKASASTVVTVVTRSYAHADTTSVSGTATYPSPNGPVWAFDNLKEQWTIKAIADPGDGANYSVIMNVWPAGSKFSGFGDPRMNSEGSSDPGGPLLSHGGVRGTIQYDISSSTAPDLNAVPDIQLPNTSLGTVLGQIFDGNQSIVGGGHYTFTYHSVAGAAYVQAG